MSTRSKSNCPICNSDKTSNMLNLECGNLDGSSLYPTVNVNGCNNCGHVFNRLSFDERTRDTDGSVDIDR